jgi:predicted SAM-dependent methyltransferase
MSVKKIVEFPFTVLFSPHTAEHFTYFLYEIYVSLIHRMGCFKARKYRVKNELKVNFGSGSVLKRGYLNVDFSADADLRLDLRRPLPLASNSCKQIFTEHFIEHLRYPEEAEQFTLECFRILQPGGEILLSVPDTAWPLQDYGLNKGDYLKVAEQEQWHPEGCNTFIEHINYHFRQRWYHSDESNFARHRFAYDFETMKKLLTNSGFDVVNEREFLHELDSEHRRLGSLFVKAEKPIKG